MNLKQELIDYLNTQRVTPENIGDFRRSLFVPWESEWNGIVRDETAAREKSTDKIPEGVSVILLTPDKKSVVMSKRTAPGYFQDFWEVPGGGIEPGEGPTSAAIRELREETGLVLSVLSVPRFEYLGEKLRTLPYAYRCYFFKVVLQPDELVRVRDTEFGKNTGWVTMDLRIARDLRKLLPGLDYFFENL